MRKPKTAAKHNAEAGVMTGSYSFDPKKKTRPKIKTRERVRSGQGGAIASPATPEGPAAELKRWHGHPPRRVDAPIWRPGDVF